MFDESFIGNSEDFVGLPLATESVSLERGLDLNFVVQNLSSKFSDREPVKAVVDGRVGVENCGGVQYSTRIEKLTVHFADGSVKAYDSEAVYESLDAEHIACLFYPELLELAEQVPQCPLVELAKQEAWG